MTAVQPRADRDEEAPEDEPHRHRWQRVTVEVIVLVAIAIVVAIVVRTFFFQAYYIPSASMEPTLHINDRVVVSRLAYHLHDPRRGDIVVFKAPPGEAPLGAQESGASRVASDVGKALGLVSDQTVLIKRVIGLPGDVVQGEGGHVFIDGHILIEPYLPPGDTTSTFGPDKVPPGEVWVMGDNRGNSTDSRVFGAIPERTIVGRAIWRIWPPWRLAFL